jgi:hypothetical protein
MDKYKVCEKNLRLFDSQGSEITDPSYVDDILKLPEFGEYTYYFEFSARKDVTTSLFALIA